MELEFYKQFGNPESPGRKFSAPARINIIGEHVDYLGGIVLPAAIDFSIDIVIRPNSSHVYRFYSENFKSFITVSEIKKAEKHTWVNYILGVIDQLQKRNLTVPGFDLSMNGNIPQGAGLSSSAALEVVVGFALSTLYNFNLSRTEIALIGQAAENEFVGTKCGIMDQFIISQGKKNNCISLNTNSLEFSYHQFDLQDKEFYLIQSNVKHSLKDSAYNTRREECESALRKIQEINPNLDNLYDLEETFDLSKVSLSLEERKRVQHVLSEKNRTKNTIAGLLSQNFDLVGKSLYECHWSLSKNFEVSCPETDFIVETLQKESILGARMIGGGFGGCVLVLDNKNSNKSYQSMLQDSYKNLFHKELSFYHFSICDGVHEIGVQS